MISWAPEEASPCIVEPVKMTHQQGTQFFKEIKPGFYTETNIRGMFLCLTYQTLDGAPDTLTEANFMGAVNGVLVHDKNREFETRKEGNGQITIRTLLRPGNLKALQAQGIKMQSYEAAR